MIEIIVATGIIIAILLIIAFKLDDKHQVLKILSLFFSIYLLVLMGKFGLDSKEVCVRELDFVYNHYSYGNNFSQSTNSADHWNSGNIPNIGTLNSVGNIFLFHINSTYVYDTHCYNQTTSNTPQTVYTYSLWYFRVVFLYVFGFLIWLGSQLLIKMIPKK